MDSDPTMVDQGVQRRGRGQRMPMCVAMKRNASSRDSGAAAPDSGCWGVGWSCHSCTEPIPFWYAPTEARAGQPRTARTIRFPSRLRDRIAADAERCGRSFEAQVVAILRHHYGESVDITPTPALILALAEASLAGMSDSDRDLVTTRLESE
jgi:hypothetical protein